ncbi:hypothetical protein TSAR_009742 [Trichomalopsis sarcophagae]|uniref:Uncharacterized protein n=1 Tax=Trichomalopsis sarcophagae TaxID=543379 RepID=A0A232EK43_9HYME|nr:hypothetical protein TSAR_009742 [Trichomalopsis sarcophagae]
MRELATWHLPDHCSRGDYYFTVVEDTEDTVYAAAAEFEAIISASCRSGLFGDHAIALLALQTERPSWLELNFMLMRRVIIAGGDGLLKSVSPQSNPMGELRKRLTDPPSPAHSAYYPHPRRKTQPMQIYSSRHRLPLAETPSTPRARMQRVPGKIKYTSVCVCVQCVCVCVPARVFKSWIRYLRSRVSGHEYHD